MLIRVMSAMIDEKLEPQGDFSMTMAGFGNGLQRHGKAVLGRGALLLAIALFAVGGPMGARAAEESKKPAVNAMTGSSAWQAEVTPSAPVGEAIVIPEDQKELVHKIDAYMQKFTDLEGRFVQTNPDNVVQKGKFYVLRPGRMRFDYRRPSRMRIVSDGKYLSIEDHDLKTVNKYPLESTPFRMLLKKDVSLERDARILALSSSDKSVSITLADKTGQSAGQIKLFFSLPEMELKEWVITDAQGLHTRIEVSDLAFEKKLASSLFKPSNIGLANVFGDQ